MEGGRGQGRREGTKGDPFGDRERGLRRIDGWMGGQGQSNESTAQSISSVAYADLWVHAHINARLGRSTIVGNYTIWVGMSGKD